MLRIGIYPRKSVYRDNSDSVQVQITACKDYARLMFKDQELDFRIYDKDEGFSGKNTHRPSFTELMADVKADELDIIIVYKLDRISRSVKDFSEIYETLQQHNVSFLSVKESFYAYGTDRYVHPLGICTVGAREHRRACCGQYGKPGGSREVDGRHPAAGHDLRPQENRR